jgi:hypothetical protein
MFDMPSRDCPHCGTRWTADAFHDYRPLLAPALIAFAAGLVVAPFSAIGSFFVWTGGTAIGSVFAFTRMRKNERALREKVPQLPEATILRDRDRK